MDLRHERSPGAGDAGASEIFQAGNLRPRDSTGPHDLQAWLLAYLRCLRAASVLHVNDIDAIGWALKSNLMSPRQAIAYADELGLLPDDPVATEAREIYQEWRARDREVRRDAERRQRRRRAA